MNDRIVDATNAASLSHLIGGKAKNLAKLMELGAPVPPWFCITTHAFDFNAGGLQSDDEQAIRDRFSSHIGDNHVAAVRSSALGEDSAADSFAGQFETYLGVSRDNLVEKVKQCFHAATSERVAQYQSARGRGEQTMAMAVIVQRMIESHVSGVLFTANPLTHDRTEAVVTAGFGLGEGVVDDRVETDTFFLDLESAAVRRQTIRPKRTKIVFDRASNVGTTCIEFPAEEQPAINQEQLQHLVGWGRRIEQFYGVPQDIEWAIDQAGSIYILQARPITTLEREQIFDNSNIVESYPGLSSPLTFTFARRAYERTFRESSRAFGVPESIIQANKNVHANLIALIDGRIYYNILNWYQLFLMLPGFEGALPAWERALGLPPRLVRSISSANWWARLRVLRNMFVQYVSLTRTANRLLRDFDSIRADFRRRDLQASDAHQLYELLEEVSDRLMGRYCISVVNDFFAQQFYDRLGKLLEKYCENGSALHNDLFRGLSGVESVEPVRSLLDIASQIRQNESLGELLASDKSESDVLAAMAAEPAWRHVWQSVQLHLEQFGDRTLQELKLETPTAEDHPEMLVSMLRNYLATGQDMSTMENQNRTVRLQAEATVRDQLRWHPLRRWQLNFFLRNSREMICHRENLRLARTRAFGMFKRIFRCLGERFVKHDLIENAVDIFYLEMDEVAGQLRGHATVQDMRRLIEIRKNDYEQFARVKLPPRINSPGLVYARRHNIDEEEPLPSSSVLHGLGCSAGRVSGIAKVVLNPDPSLVIRNEILVAPATDPGWVFLMVAAKGLVVEKGSLLSHTAIIGRELGIPTVVGVTEATRMIRDGQTIEIDGHSGQVRMEPP